MPHSFSALLNNSQTGIITGWTSPILSIIQSPNSTIPTTSTEGSWMATSVPLVSMFCTPLAAISIHTLGRRISLAITVIPFLVSSVMIAFASTATELIYARAVTGLGMAFSFTVTPVYLGEIAPNNLRSTIGLGMTVANNIGILWIYVIGTAVDIWVSSILCSIAPVLFLALYVFVPETPYFLIKQNKIEESKAVLKKLRNGPVDEEFEAIKTSILDINFWDSVKELWREKRHKRALLISVGAFFVAQFTGGVTFIFYAHLIFKKAGDVSANTLSTIKAVLQLFSSILSAYFVETTGKRPLLIASCIGSSVFMAAEGIYFYLHDNGYNVDQIWWLPLIAMILFNMCQAIGLSSIPVVFLGELFDSNVKSLAVCISKTSLALAVFIVGEVFQVLLDNFGNCAPFFVFCAMGLLGVLFVIFLVPETRGKSLQDIQYYLEHNTYDRNMMDKSKINAAYSSDGSINLQKI